MASIHLNPLAFGELGHHVFRDGDHLGIEPQHPIGPASIDGHLVAGGGGGGGHEVAVAGPGANGQAGHRHQDDQHRHESKDPEGEAPRARLRQRRRVLQRGGQGGGRGSSWIGQHGDTSAAIVFKHVHHHTGDVVPATAGVGQGDQGSGRLHRVRQLAQRGRYASVTDLVEQPVAAQQIPVSDQRRPLPPVDLNDGLDPDDPGQDVAVGMHGGFLGSELPVAH